MDFDELQPNALIIIAEKKLCFCVSMEKNQPI